MRKLESATGSNIKISRFKWSEFIYKEFVKAPSVFFCHFVFAKKKKKKILMHFHSVKLQNSQTNHLGWWETTKDEAMLNLWPSYLHRFESWLSLISCVTSVKLV